MNQVQNSVTLIGNLGKDPQPINTQKDDTTMISFSLATNEVYNNKQGEKVTTTQWHRCVAFGKKAEVIKQYAQKGSKMAVQGSLRYTRYTDKEGVERFSVDITVNDFAFLDSKPEAQSA
ncbi:MAG: single-stranded DNA-binding protein [Bacteroidetes bacterium]|nr:MAG: single-stranded DNA-binding protein [Bacteroidota bacterium]PTM12773.1 MAG: single-stranded DNA-binding protein [Bacteroidota bacterium]